MFFLYYLLFDRIGHMKRLTVLLALVFLLSLSPQVSAVTALGPGYYQNTDSSLVYTGTWTTGTANSGSYGGSFASTASTAAIVTVYTLPTVNSFGLFYAMNSFGGSFQITVNGSSTYGPYNSYQPAPVLNQYVQIALPAGTNKVEIYSVSNSFYYHAIQLLAVSPTAAAINLTAVVAFPTHTPTPTNTPTRTPTPGPSPTPTATPTRTPDFVSRSSVETTDGEQDVGVVFQISAGEVGIIALVGVLVGLNVITMFMAIRREK